MTKKKKKNKNYYFTEKHEKAILDYTATKDSKKRTELYVNLIGPAFSEMVDKIVYTYRFITLSNIENLQSECKIWLTTILDKFDETKGSKAFSYFSVITKNWFIHKIKKSSQKTRREIQYEDLSYELEQEYMSVDNGYLSKREEIEFWLSLKNEIDLWRSETLKENEKKILKAIKILFDNINEIEIFNKKAVYLYLREITGLNTKQVVISLNKIREKYRNFKNKWNNDKI